MSQDFNSLSQSKLFREGSLRLRATSGTLLPALPSNVLNLCIFVTLTCELWWFHQNFIHPSNCFAAVHVKREERVLSETSTITYWKDNEYLSFGAFHILPLVLICKRLLYIEYFLFIFEENKGKSVSPFVPVASDFFCFFISCNQRPSIWKTTPTLFVIIFLH